MEVIQYGDPDQSGEDLKAHNQVYIRCETYHDEAEIRTYVEQGRDYYFCRGDFLLISIRKKAGFTLIPTLRDQTVSIRYGGTIKYEAF